MPCSTSSAVSVTADARRRGQVERHREQQAEDATHEREHPATASASLARRASTPATAGITRNPNTNSTPAICTAEVTTMPNGVEQEVPEE